MTILELLRSDHALYLKMLVFVAGSVSVKNKIYSDATYCHIEYTNIYVAMISVLFLLVCTLLYCLYLFMFMLAMSLAG